MKVFESFPCDSLFKISRISALDSISEHYFENEAMIAWWNAAGKREITGLKSRKRTTTAAFVAK